MIHNNKVIPKGFFEQPREIVLTRGNLSVRVGLTSEGVTVDLFSDDENLASHLSTYEQIMERDKDFSVNKDCHVPCGDKCNPEDAKKNCKVCPGCNACIDYYSQDNLAATGGKCFNCFHKQSDKELEENVYIFLWDFWQDAV